MKAIFFGAPGAGKGTQSKIIAKMKDASHISSGDILRAEVQLETNLGKTAKSYIEKGALVPDDIIIRMLEDFFRNGKVGKNYIFDGFPRTLPQAKSLDEMLEDLQKMVDIVLNIDVEEPLVIERVLDRVSCKECGAIYSLSMLPPKVEGVCDVCHKRTVTRRSDDNRTSIQHRLDAYNADTKPMISYYEQRGIVVHIDGNQSVENVTKSILKVL